MTATTTAPPGAEPSSNGNGHQANGHNGTCWWADQCADLKVRFPGNLIDLIEKRGFTPQTIRENGWYDTGDSREVARVLNRTKVDKRQGGALILPFYGPTGDVHYYQVKPDRAAIRNGKPVKYVCPTGATPKPYFPAGTRQRIEDGATELIITESVFKAAAANQNGFTAIGLIGVDCWHYKKSSALLPELEAINWKGRIVFIIFDSDAATNARVMENIQLLAAALEKRGAVAKAVFLPAGISGAKNGLDDFLRDHGAGALRRLMDQAEPPEAPDPAAMKEPAKSVDPADICKLVMDEAIRDGISRLRYWRGSWWKWRHGRYEELSADEVRAGILRLFSNVAYDIRSRYVSDVMEHLRASAIVPAAVQTPSWLDEPPADWQPEECIATTEHLVHWPSIVAGIEPSIVPSTPAFFSLNATDYDVDPEAPPPTRWLQYLSELWPDDQESIDTSQEIFGYLLSNSTLFQKVFMFIGPVRSGKGTFIRVVKGVIGVDNYCGPTMASLSKQFGLEPLISKSIGAISDAQIGRSLDVSVIVERLLAISGEDTLTFDRKHKGAWTGKLNTRFVLLSNELPSFKDASAAIVSRIILIQFPTCFLGKEDRNLTKKLLTEKQGILLWALQGLRRLQERGYFIQPKTAQASLDQLEYIASPMKLFIRDKCILGPGKRVKVDELFHVWRHWCKSQGRKRATGDVQSFGKMLRAAEQSIPAAKQVRDGKMLVRVYDGIDVKDYKDVENQAELYPDINA